MALARLEQSEIVGETSERALTRLWMASTSTLPLESSEDIETPERLCAMGTRTLAPMSSAMPASCCAFLTSWPTTGRLAANPQRAPLVSLCMSEAAVANELALLRSVSPSPEVRLSFIDEAVEETTFASAWTAWAER